MSRVFRLLMVESLVVLLTIYRQPQHCDVLLEQVIHPEMLDIQCCCLPLHAKNTRQALCHEIISNLPNMEDPNDILHNGHNKLFTVFDVKWMKVGVTLSKFTLNDDTFS
ncbi:hypothetical protein YC2023_088223 [Brassica napus]